MNEKPEKCDLLEIWLRRSEYVNQEVLNEFARLKRGIEGEKVVLEYIKKYGRKHWKVMSIYGCLITECLKVIYCC